MANWINRGMSASVRDHHIEINGTEAEVTIDLTLGWTSRLSLAEMRGLAALYAEAVQYMASAEPAAAGTVLESSDPEPLVGTCLRDGVDDFWRRETDGWHLWFPSGWGVTGDSWSTVCDNWAPLTVVDMDDPDMPWSQS